MADKQRDNTRDFTGNNETYKRGEHPKSQANLAPWKKGESGNPVGRPAKYEKLAKALKDVGKLPPNSWDWDAENWRLSVLHQIWYRASEGSISHIRILAELGCLDGDE